MGITTSASDKICKYKQYKLDANKKIHQLIDEAYQIFKSYLDGKNLNFENEQVDFKTEKNIFTFREQSFEHLISKQINKPHVRIYDKNRIVHIPYIETILNQCCNESCENLKIFRDDKYICVWCEMIDFLIVLSKREKKGYLLLTAYPITYPNKRKTLKKTYMKNNNV